jgi:A/G-specific adenine glycosylase
MKRARAAGAAGAGGSWPEAGAVRRAKRAVRTRLVPWFRGAARVLPWRREPRSGYAVWVSEIMLQQTRVETVVPYFEQFMRDYPTVRALAAAPLDGVLKHWEGLGYYTRARNLHRAAQIVAERHGGEVPGEADALRALPGLGDYTVAAIGSFAFGLPLAVLDGNVMRVLARLFALDWDIAKPASRAKLQSLADALLAREAPGACNEAWMELGAMVCKPKGAACGECPLAGICAARAEGGVERYPVRGGAKAVPHKVAGAAIVRDGKGGVLVVRRPPEAGGLLAGLWQLPAAEAAGTGAEALREAAERAAEAAGVRGGRAVGEEEALVRHAFSHFTLETHAFSVEFDGKPPRGAAGKRAFARRETLGRFAFGKTDLTILRQIGIAE